MECQLGRWTRQYITINNPSDDGMDIEICLDNQEGSCFTIDLPLVPVNDSQRLQLISVNPKSSMEIPIQFMPNTLGLGNHRANVTLKSKQMGEVVYIASGRGLAPLPMEPLSVSASVGSNTSLILPFRNPTDVPVLADITMVDNEQTINDISSSVIRKSINVESAFCLLLKHVSNVKLEGRQSFDVPFTFSPDLMKQYEGTLAIALRREDGKPWPDEYADIKDTDVHPAPVQQLRPLSRGNDGSIKSIRWVFPVHGIPEVRSTSSKEAVLQCQARSRIEERLEVTLTGAIPSSSSGHDLIKLRAVTPINERRVSSANNGVVVEGRSVAEEFSHEIHYPDAESKQQLEQALAINLVRKERDPHTGLVVLVFNIVFSPFRPLRQSVNLTVTSATGGVWSFPLSINASEPPPDDVIDIESAGLGKDSTVSFVLFSHSRHPIPFTAFFVGGGEEVFSVSPSNGELLPPGTVGTRMFVSFNPKMYGKSYSTRLIVQTLDMQWTFPALGMGPC